MCPSFGVKDEQGKLIDWVFSQERGLTRFAIPSACYPYALTLANSAQPVGNRSVESKTLQARPSTATALLSGFHMGLTHRDMKLDYNSIAFKISSKYDILIF